MLFVIALSWSLGAFATSQVKGVFGNRRQFSSRAWTAMLGLASKVFICFPFHWGIRSKQYAMVEAKVPAELQPRNN